MAAAAQMDAAARSAWVLEVRAEDVVAVEAAKTVSAVLEVVVEEDANSVEAEESQAAKEASCAGPFRHRVLLPQETQS